MDIGLTPEERDEALHSMHLSIDAATAAQLLMRSEDDILDDETYEDIHFIDDDYEPGIKKRASSKGRATRSKAKSQTVAAKKKTTEKLLKKEIELPIKIDLIGLVKKERSLYNLKDPLYMNRIHKDKVWVDISEVMMQKYPEMIYQDEY